LGWRPAGEQWPQPSQPAAAATSLLAIVATADARHAVD